ncbi:M23 family metallopeptidase [Hymenobacter defluvii]|uniref:M23 family metallopeptidase n=1 Tax=Hymenobacter defluvii TaxID=2054411 RepID=A0ABS3T9S6_9BACT|nr:M23 family metallopeptidase [Hymenobacter defluvii]MBO3270412.1 M23 family metallopeptidase [Hymenobacter defluvii]
MPTSFSGWRLGATVATLLLTTLGLRPVPFAGEVPAPAADAPTSAAPDSSSVVVPSRMFTPVEVPKGYFLFPIKPGKPNFLAASMGEIRPNHFHGGLDIKTDGRVDLPVYSSADGYISRLKQSSFGYGNVLYITHPNGLTTVYGHLNRFLGPVADTLLRRQYQKQTYELELFFDKDQIPVKRGQIVALSGNTGGSGGPHVHWEVRTTKDEQLNPLQWGGFPEIQDHVPPSLLSFAVEPLTIDARVQGLFEKRVFLPKTPTPNAPYTHPDTIQAYGTVGLLLQAVDRFDGVWNKYGLQHVAVTVNGQPLYEHRIDGVPFTESRQISDHIDYDWQKMTGRTLEKLFVDDGNTIPLYTTGPGKGTLRVEDGQLYTVEIRMRDSYGNTTPVSFVLRGQQPAYFKTRSAAVKQPSLRYDITRNILKVLVADPDTATQVGNLTLTRGARRLQLRPSYVQQSQNVYLYDLRAGLPDSLLFGKVHRAFNRQALVPSGRDWTFADAHLNLSFAPRTLFDTLYLQTSYQPLAGGTYTVQNLRTPLLQALRLTLKPEQEVTDKARSAVYMINSKGGKIYQGGKWAGNQITTPIKTFGMFRVLTDTIAPSARVIRNTPAGLTFVVGDNLSGLSSYRLLVNGQWRLLRYEYKNATLFTVKEDTLGPPLHGTAELHLEDQAGNKKVIPVKLK